MKREMFGVLPERIASYKRPHGIILAEFNK